MKDIEKFIRENKEAFDSYQPGERVLKNLEKEFCDPEAKGGVVRTMPWLKWSAAAAVIIFIAAGVVYFSSSERNYAPAVAANTAEIPPEYAEEVYHFTRLIELKHQELKKIRKVEPELYKKFSADITRLDSSYQVLKKDLPGNPNEELVLSAMIENLRIQIDLLNEQLTIIKKIKEVKNSNHEKIYKST
jgi:hypothetical protein